MELFRIIGFSCAWSWSLVSHRDSPRPSTPWSTLPVQKMTADYADSEDFRNPMKSQSLQIGATIFQEEVYSLSLWASERQCREACPTRLCDFATNSSARNLPKTHAFDEDTPNSEFQAFPVHLGHFPWLSVRIFGGIETRWLQIC